MSGMTLGELFVIVPLTLLCTVFPLSIALLLGSMQRRLVRIEQHLAQLASEHAGRAGWAGRAPFREELATPRPVPPRADGKRATA